MNERRKRLVNVTENEFKIMSHKFTTKVTPIMQKHDKVKLLVEAAYTTWIVSTAGTMCAHNTYSSGQVHRHYRIPESCGRVTNLTCYLLDLKLFLKVLVEQMMWRMLEIL